MQSPSRVVNYLNLARRGMPGEQGENRLLGNPSPEGAQGRIAVRSAGKAASRGTPEMSPTACRMFGGDITIGSADGNAVP